MNEAGITKGALFHHFENKQALYLAVWRDLQTEMDLETQRVALESRSPEDPYKAILAGCRCYLEWAMRPDYQRIVLVEGRGALGMAEWMVADREFGQRKVWGAIEYLVKRGKVAPERAVPMSVILQGALHGSGVALSRKVPGVTVHSLYEALERLLRQMN